MKRYFILTLALLCAAAAAAADYKVDRDLVYRSDDEYAERELLADILCRRMPHEAEVRTAEHGRGAVEAAVLWGADLVLLDIEMPGINGLDAARQILAQRPGTKVLFITAYSLFEYAHEAVHLGACDYILKPVQPDEVEASVRRAIAQAEALEKAGIVFDSVVSLEVSDETIMERMSGRRVCPDCGASYHVVAVPPKSEGVCDKCGGKLIQRKDDAPETVKSRLEVYHKETEPLKAFYAERGLLKTVENQPTVEANSQAILRVLGR